MTMRDSLIRLLADAQPHSGSALAAALGVTRSAVWKQVHRLEEVGLEASSDEGYRLSRALELLDRSRLLAALAPDMADCCGQLDIHAVTESTSADLLAAPPPSPGTWRAVLAEFQTAGRGRRGRSWWSAWGSGLCLSVAWCYASAPRELPALSLAAGLAVRRALAGAGAAGVSLKWPNDIVFEGGKLGGLLVDVDGESQGPLRVVIGLGLNLTLSPRQAQSIAAAGGLPATALDRVPGGDAISRNALAAAVISALVQALREFDAQGFRPLAAEWSRHDFLAGRHIRVLGGGSELQGVARGIGPDGGLLVERAGALVSVFSGDVSVRTDV